MNQTMLFYIIIGLIWILIIFNKKTWWLGDITTWTPKLSWFYKKDYFFTQNEYYFFKRLKYIFHEMWLDQQYTIFSKVKVRDIITLRKNQFDTLKRSNQWHFDFIICDDTKAFHPIMAIELDDNSHNTNVVEERDRLKNLLCEEVWFPLFRLYQSSTDEEIKKILKQSLQ